MTRAIISYDENGVPAGVMDLDYVQSRPTQILAQVFRAKDWEDKSEVMGKILDQIAPDDQDLKVISLVGALAELLQILDGATLVVDTASGMNTKAKLQEIYGLEEAA